MHEHNVGLTGRATGRTSNITYPVWKTSIDKSLQVVYEIYTYKKIGIHAPNHKGSMLYIVSWRIFYSREATFSGLMTVRS